MSDRTTLHPDPAALALELAVRGPDLRQDVRVEQALAVAGAHGAVCVDDSAVEVWMLGCLSVDEGTAVLAGAHDALHDPAGWPWRELGHGLWLLWLFVVEEPAFTVPQDARDA